jgi:hypothetical protein
LTPTNAGRSRTDGVENPIHHAHAPFWSQAASTITDIALYAYTLRGGRSQFQPEPLPADLKADLLDQSGSQVSDNE